MSGQPAALAPLRPRRRWIWITVALLTATIIVLPVAFRLWSKEVHQNQPLPVAVYKDPVTSLRVVAPAGDVMVEPGSQSGVTVGGELSWVFGKPSVAVHQTIRGQTMQITAACPRPNPFEDCAVRLVIHVPGALAVDVSTGAGTVRVRGLSGPLHLAVTSGSIAMTDVSGPVWASAGSGSVTGSGLSPATLQTVIGSGSLRLGLSEPPRDLTVAIGSGSARVAVPAGTRMRVLGDAGSGVLRVPPGLADDSAPATLSATIGTGQVEVSYSPSART
jgi:hypothetical protein